MDYWDEVKTNEEQFEKVLATCHPGLWRIHQTLKDTKLNPEMVPMILSSIHEVAFLHGHGVIHIYIEGGKITGLEPTSRIRTNLAVLIEEEIENS